MADTENKPVENNQVQAPQPAPVRQDTQSTDKASKQEYTFPDEAVVIEATSLEDAVKQLNQNKKDEK
jgi:hypothetical protein